MKLKSLWPLAFGRFHAKEPILLEDGLNIITGDNESGKSTLAAFILGMLYGFKKEGRTRVYRTPEFERYRPWTGKEYRGVLVYEADGRRFRVERWFDPDITKIYDDVTGEEITHEFLQDPRREYNFVQRHLGLSAKEFCNTIWIGQLGSVQDRDLGLEIQGKLESIIQGTSDDLSFAQALAALNEERAKIKTPRSTRARLDVVQQQKAELASELEQARAREAQARQIMVELRNLRQREAELEQNAREAARRADWIRAALLRKVVSQAKALLGDIAEFERRLNQVEWAKDLPEDIKGELDQLVRAKAEVNARLQETRAQLADLETRRKALENELEQYRTVLASGLTPDQVSGLYSKYLACKASAGRSERHANEARRVLRQLEQQAVGMEEPAVLEGALAEAEKLREIAVLAEREKVKLEVEMEQARVGLTQADAKSAGSWLYALSLAVLGIAIALTIVGLPLAIPAFAISVVVFGIGSYTRKKALEARSRAEQVFNQAKSLVEEQERRVAKAQEDLRQFLEAHGAASVEELRRKMQEVSEFHTRLNNARDQYELAHRYWYEASQELSATERELMSALSKAGCLTNGQAVTDGAVETLRSKLKRAAAIQAEIAGVDSRIQESEAMLAKFNAKRDELDQTEVRLLETARVESVEQLYDKIAAHDRYRDISRTLTHLREKLDAVLSGRSFENLEAELSQVESALGAFPGGDHREDELSDEDYREAQNRLDQIRAELSALRERKAAIEKEVVLLQREGRPVYSIEEDLAELEETEKELTLDKQALDLAIETLEDLSRSLRREFAPMLNWRVGEILKLITRGRYVEARISPDLEMSVIHPGSNAQTPVESLSGGTIDQCYFALRVAVAELIVNSDTFPFFLDDSFVQYDDKRLQGALEILAELAKRHQILLFSCHGRELSVVRRLGIPCNVVDLNELGEQMSGT